MAAVQTSTESTETSSSRRSIHDALSELPLGLGAVLLGFLLLAKLYAVAEYSLTTAATIVGASASKVLWGTLASYAYVIVAAAAFVSLFVWIRSGGLRLGPLWSILRLGGFCLLSLMTPLSYWLWLLLVFVAAMAWLLIRPRISSRAFSWSLEVVVVALGVVALTWTVVRTLEQPWLAAEVIAFGKPEVTAQHRQRPNDLAPMLKQVTTGYVLSVDGDWTSILDADRRYVSRVPNDNIRARYICRAEGTALPGERPIYRIFQREEYNSPNIDCKTLELRISRQEIPVQQR